MSSQSNWWSGDASMNSQVHTPAPAGSTQRTEKGVIKVDTDQLQKDIAIDLYSSLTMLERSDNAMHKSYFDAKVKSAHNLVNKTGFDQTRLYESGVRQASDFITKHARENELKEIETKMTAVSALINNMKEQIADDDGGKSPVPGTATAPGEFKDLGNGHVHNGLPSRSTRGSSNAKRKMHEDDLVKILTDALHQAKKLKENRRASS